MQGVALRMLCQEDSRESPRVGVAMPEILSPALPPSRVLTVHEPCVERVVHDHHGHAMRSISGRSRVTHFMCAPRRPYLPPHEKSSNAVTLSAFVHTPTAPAPEMCSSSKSMYCFPSSM